MSWAADVLTNALQSQGLRCSDQTSASAQKLLDHGQLTAEDFMETSPEIEKTLMEAFLEDDYEGTLHLTTLSMPKNDKNEMTIKTSNDDEPSQQQQQQQQQQSTTVTDDEIVVGLAFWREIPKDEMGEWLDLKRISEIITKHRSLQSAASSTQSTLLLKEPSTDHHDDHVSLSNDGRQAMKLVRNKSIGWIESAVVASSSQHSQARTGTNNDNLNTSNLESNNTATIQSTVRKLTHSWIKVELIAIQKSYRSHHLGNILLGCTLSRAHDLYHKEHAVLHVAGGGATKNVPAAKLYKRYGFVSIPRHDEGGPFCKPDRDLFVLGDIAGSLEGLPWGEMLHVSSSDGDGLVYRERENIESQKRKATSQHCV